MANFARSPLDNRFGKMIRQLGRLLAVFLIVGAWILHLPGQSWAEPGDLFAAELEGFVDLDPRQFNLTPQNNPTDALWQLFRSVDIGSLNSVNIQTRPKQGYAVVDVKLDGVSDPGIRAVFYRGIAERSVQGWVITRLGRQHRCSRFGMGVLPTWTTAACL